MRDFVSEVKRMCLVRTECTSGSIIRIGDNQQNARVLCSTMSSDHLS
jgi:hypothetical protein